MDSVIINANAKINLTLDVINKRSDGYHNLKMIMMEIPLYDIVSISKSDDISLSSNLSYLPNNMKNTAYKAAMQFFSFAKIKGGAKIYIEKNIPICAGLAGGSTDAAAVLKGLNILYNTSLSQKQLEEIGDKIGKDVPFCVRGGVALAEGTGNILTDLPVLPSCYIVMIKPYHINVSTKDVFSAIDVNKIELHPDTKGVIEGLYENDLIKISRRLYNVLENTTAKMHPIISDIKKIFIDNGTLGAVMSGSGPTVFGLFKEEEKAKLVYEKLKKIDNQVYFFKI
jgi:4-diphosphocytidyl-2-C-methyl-D-erythritol kinase